MWCRWRRFGSEIDAVDIVRTAQIWRIYDDGGDCDDDNPAIHPDAVEVCDEIDNDCDTFIDDNDDSLDSSTGTEYYADLDDDTYGDPNNVIAACLQPADAVENSEDCNDLTPTLNLPFGKTTTK